MKEAVHCQSFLLPSATRKSKHKNHSFRMTDSAILSSVKVSSAVDNQLIRRLSAGPLEVFQKQKEFHYNEYIEFQEGNSMTDNKPSGRPTGRPGTGKTGSAGVHKRGEGLGTGKVGNVDYDERKASAATSSNQAPSGDRNMSNNPLTGIGGLGGYTGSSGSHYSGGQSGYHGNTHYTHSSEQSPLNGIGGLGSGNTGMPGGAPKKRSGGLLRIIFMILLVLFVMNMLGMCGGGSSGNNGGSNSGLAVTSTPAPTTAPSSASNPSASVNGTWNAPTTTYVDANASAVSTTVAQGAREKFTKLKGDGKDTVTMLVYMCGTDLETNYGMATTDLNEMLYAQNSDKLNIVVETGGTKRWKNSVISSSTNQRWLIKNRNISALDKNVGKKAMTDPTTLTDFIKWGAKNYPADRYILVLWDHGGGSLAGYAHDELYPNGTMTVDEISSALKNGGIKFDIIGFDACLMANMETAIAVEPYADYLLASDETEPGTGWYYTNWVSSLAKNTSTPSTELGKQIIDDFINASHQSSSRDKTTLSLIDLAEFSGTIPGIFSEFSKEIVTEIHGDNFQQVANARGTTREFAPTTRIDQIDLIHFCKNLGTASSNALASSIQSCVKYNRCNNITNAYGLSIYFPYYSPRNVSGAVKVYENIGMDSNYTSAVRSFATMAASGQVVNSNNTNTLFDILGGGSSYSGSQTYDPMDILSLLLGGGSSSSGYDSYGYDSGYYSSPYTNSYGSGYSGQGISVYDLLGGSSGADESVYDLFSQLYGRAHVNAGNLILTENSAGQKTLSLSQSEWDAVRDINLNVWVDDGEGYIDLGIDPIYSFDDEGALIVDYDGLWAGINGQVVSYYPLYAEPMSEQEYRYGFYVPIMYNGERADIILEYNNDAPSGEVLGIRKVYEDGITAKGYLEMNDGDTIEFLCDYYDYDGNYQDTYYLGEPLTVSGDLVVDRLELEDVTALFGYRLTDIYNANMWTPMLEYNN